VKWRDGCCLEASDCGVSDCHDAFCMTNVCRLAPTINNNSVCSDKDVCTVADHCVNGKCEGYFLTCNDNQCTTGSCYKGVGCVYENKIYGTTCDDNNPCTIDDTCISGQCASGIEKDCSEFDTICTMGVCDISSGICYPTNINEGLVCDDDRTCTFDTECKSGECKGTLNQCFDNNPCTIDACVEDIGCMVQQKYVGGKCLPGCVSDDICPMGYICHDGTCIRIDVNENANIRFLSYEVEKCEGSNYKLIMKYALDAPRVTVGMDLYYRVIANATDIVASTHPLGFINETEITYVLLNNDTSRTLFSLSTACQRVTPDNCETIFSNRAYGFNIFIKKCYDLTLEHCINPNLYMSAHIALSISDCTNFGDMDATWVG